MPVASIEKLLTERPAIQGIALPGMFSGSPGMLVSKTERWRGHAFSKGRSSVYHVVEDRCAPRRVIIGGGPAWDSRGGLEGDAPAERS